MARRGLASTVEAFREVRADWGCSALTRSLPSRDHPFPGWRGNQVATESPGSSPWGPIPDAVVPYPPERRTVATAPRRPRILPAPCEREILNSGSAGDQILYRLLIAILCLGSACSKIRPKCWRSKGDRPMRCEPDWCADPQTLEINLGEDLGGYYPVVAVPEGMTDVT